MRTGLKHQLIAGIAGLLIYGFCSILLAVLEGRR